MSVSTRKFQPRPLKLDDERTVTIEMLQAEDAEILIDFLQELGRETTFTLQHPGRNYSLYAIQQRLARTVQSPADLLLCAKDNGMIIANLDFQTQNDTHPWIKHIARFGMAVLQRYQGFGIGKALVKSMEEWAPTAGITRIEGICRTDNERGLNLYRGLGYSLEGLRHNAAKIGDDYKDEYYLAKILDSQEV